MADRTVSVEVTARVDGFVSAMQTAERTAGYFATRMQRYARDHGAAMQDIGGKASIMGGAILAGIGLAVKAWGDFSDRMVQVQVASGATRGEMDQLSQAALSMGTAFGMSANDVADAQIELGKAGLSAGQMLSGGLGGALALAAAGQIGVSEATEIATTALSQFKLEGKDVPHVADLLAAGANKALGGVDELGQALKQGGLVASSFGVSIDETVGTLAAFAQQGLLGSDAGTSLKTMLIALANPSKEAAGKMRELGINAYDAQGNFIGLAGLADQLQIGMKDLTQEQRNQALATIFGTDAIRSANVLFAEGAEGIRKWTADVNDQGYAALAAAKNMDSLNGDFKKLNSTFQNGLIEMGKQADGFLRPVVQSITGALQAFNDLPEPVKGAGLAMAAATGGALLLGGGFLSLAPRVFDTISGFRELTRSAPRVAGALGAVGKAAAGIAIVTTAVVALGSAVTQKNVTTMTEFAEAVTRVAAAGSGARSSDLDSIFKKWDSSIGDVQPKMDNMADAIKRITNPEWNDGTSRWADQFTPFAKTITTQIDDKLKALGETMGNLASNGAADKAAASFRLLANEFERNGSNAQDALDHVPAYRDALTDLATKTGVTLTQQELLDFAMGKIPAKLSDAANATSLVAKAQEMQKAATEEQMKHLEDLGINIEGKITILENFISALSRAGLTQLSTRDAVRGYKEALDGVDAAIAKNGTSLDINTKAGRENQAALDNIAKAGFSVLDSMAKQTDANGKNVNSAADLQKSLKQTYDDLVVNAGQFGITGGAADELARSVLGIPPGVSIDSWMSDFALQKAKETKGELDKIDGRRVVIYTDHYITELERRAQLPDLNGPDVSGSGRPGLASGGRVVGPGGPTDDKAGAFDLSNGEYVLKARVAAAIGYDKLDRINGGDVGTMTAPPIVVSAPAVTLPTPAAPSGRSVTVTNNIHEAVSPAATAIEVTRRLAFKFA